MNLAKNQRPSSRSGKQSQGLFHKNSFSVATLIAISGLAAAYGIAIVFRLLAATSAATLYLAPAIQALTPRQLFTVEVRENSGTETTNAVQANLVYPADKLEYVSVSDSPAFPTRAPSSGGEGLIKIARGTEGGTSLTGDQLVATVTFQAKTVGGSAAISFASGSVIVNSRTFTDTTPSISGGTYTIRATSITPIPTPTAHPTPPLALPSTHSTSPIPPPASRQPSSPAVTPAPSPQGPSPTLVSDLTTSLTVEVKIIDFSGKAKEGIQVVADSGIYTSSAGGIALVKNLQPGKQTLLIKAGELSQYSVINVENLPPASPAQAVTVKFLAARQSSSFLPVIIVILIITLLVGIGTARQFFRGRPLGLYRNPRNALHTSVIDVPQRPHIVYPAKAPQSVEQDPDQPEVKNE